MPNLSIKIRRRTQTWNCTISVRYLRLVSDYRFCTQYQRHVELIGRRWTAVIIRALLAGICQFTGLKDAIPGISDRMLSERLRELEAEGILTRTVIPETPVKVMYQLTDKGCALEPVLTQLIEWIGEWGSADPMPLVVGSSKSDSES